MLGQVERVVVAVPSEEAAVAEFGGEFEGSVACNSYSQSCAAFVEARGVGNAVDLEAGNFEQAGHESMQQAAFVLVDRLVSGFDCGSSGRGFGASVSAQVCKIFHAGGDSRDAFVIERAPLPAVWNGVCVRANLVR